MPLFMMKSIIKQIIEPEERKIKNYFNPLFWKKKAEDYNQLREKEKTDLDVYKTLAEGARPTIEYYILIVISCLIATSGLIQGSSATIIGAMIVAPLMTPILSFSLGVIWGDFNHMKTALSSLTKGVLLAVFISSLIAYFIPITDFSAEIMARTRPSIFDILVALASGIVGAYGYANKKMSNTIVGIAIAVALMPPLCTVGIGLGTADYAVASGAFILFIINLVSISLAGAVVFWIMEIHPLVEEKADVLKRAVSQIVFSVVILALISVPVFYYMKEGYVTRQNEKIIDQIIHSSYPNISVMEMHSVKSRDGYHIQLTLKGDKAPFSEGYNDFVSRIRKECNGVQGIEVHFIESTLLMRVESLYENSELYKDENSKKPL